jgi:hypothetical protein
MFEKEPDQFDALTIMVMNKQLVLFNADCFLSGFQDCRQQGCCRQGDREVFTPCLEGQIGNNLQLVNRHLKP